MKNQEVVGITSVKAVPLAACPHTLRLSTTQFSPGRSSTPGPDIEIVGTVPDAPPAPAGGTAVTVVIILPPGSPGGPPHRHSVPAYGYVVKGAIVFEIEGQPEPVVREGEAFGEPGGDVIHYRGANHLADAESVFTATTFVAPGQPLLTVVPEEELEARRHLRAGAPVSSRPSPDLTG